MAWLCWPKISEDIIISEYIQKDGPICTDYPCKFASLRSKLVSTLTHSKRWTKSTSDIFKHLQTWSWGNFGALKPIKISLDLGIKQIPRYLYRECRLSSLRLPAQMMLSEKPESAERSEAVRNECSVGWSIATVLNKASRVFGTNSRDI